MLLLELLLLGLHQEHLFDLLLGKLLAIFKRKLLLLFYLLLSAFNLDLRLFLALSHLVFALFDFFDHAVSAGLLKERHRGAALRASTVAEAVALLGRSLGEVAPKWVDLV